MKNMRNSTLIILLTLVGLLTLPMWQHADAISYVAPQSIIRTCVNLPTPMNDRVRAAVSWKLRFCLPRPPVTMTPNPPSTATPTSTPTSTPTQTATPLPAANITVYNTGSFFVQYYISYNLPGLPLQSLYSGVFNINQGITLPIPGTATNVSIFIQGYTGITGWQTACTRFYPQATNAVIIVSGTTFSPTCTG